MPVTAHGQRIEGVSDPTNPLDAVNLQTLQAAIASPSTDRTYQCTAACAVGDAVYVSAPMTVDRASSAVLATSLAIGFVVSKPDAIHAVVREITELSAFVGLTPGAPYWLDPVPGAIALAPPTLPPSVVMPVGVARDATTLVIRIASRPVRR